MARATKKVKGRPSVTAENGPFVLKHLRFVYVATPNIRRKTSIWEVESTHSDDKLGYIQWYPKWRKYTFWPDANTIYDPACLRELTVFMDAATLSHKMRKSSEQPTIV